MTDHWPPPGHKDYYNVTEPIDNEGGEVSFDLSVPNLDVIDVATVRVLRHGGPTAEDIAFRRKLYALIGGITVAAGHVEEAMKRVILVLNGAASAEFASIEKKNWTDLERELARHSERDIPQAPSLRALLDWGAKNEVKRRRDDVVHAYWWDYEGCGVRRSRFYRDGDGGSATLCGTFDDLLEDLRMMVEYARALEDAMEPFWPQARLPAPPATRPDARI
jgi:hypothetical protein